MTRLEFEQALDRWGADLTRWPARDAEAAPGVLQVGKRRWLRLIARPE